jgi:hypothetical protein
MITALISALTGLASGIVPDVLKEVRDSRQATREMQFLRLNHELTLERAKAEAGARMDEAEMSMLTASIQATKEQIVAIVQEQARPTGIAWIDGFNALVRPTTAIIFVLMFAVGLCSYSFGIVQNDAFGVTLTTLFGESMQAVLGFMFGARAVATTKKAAAA